MQEKTTITFIGGLDSIGKNMMVLENQKDAIIIDCGMSFPSDWMYGIDTVIPNFEYIKKIKNKIRALFLTHGHEDHIGALGYLYKEINPPLYGTPVTLGFASEKFSGTQRKKLKTIEIAPGQVYEFNKIKIEPFYVCHSIPDGVGLIISTPDGTIVHSGDFKLDNQPMDGKMTDLRRLKKLRNVSLLLCDSTNADQPGKTLSEEVVGQSFDKLIKQATGRVILSSFSSNIYRIQNAINAAYKNGRKIAIIGRSMQQNYEIALKNKIIDVPAQTVFTNLHKIKTFPDNKIVIMTTGSQGERMAALTKMANRNYPDFKLNEKDTVIISASPIPGNEKNINENIDNFTRIGVKLFYEREENIHASGHACAEEIKTLLKIVRPRYYVPVHGEYLHLKANAELALSLHMAKKNIFILRNGQQLSLSRGKCFVSGMENGLPVLIDGNYFATPSDGIFDERYRLSRKGILTLAVFNDRVAIISHGFLHKSEQAKLLPEIKITAELFLKKVQKLPLKDKEHKLKRELEKYLLELTRRRPVVEVAVIS